MGIIETVSAGTLKNYPRVPADFKFPSVAEPGLPNFTLCSLTTSIVPLTAFNAFVQKYLNVKKIPQLPIDIVNFPTAVIKQMTDTYTANLKLPDVMSLAATEMATASAFPVSIPSAPSVPSVPDATSVPGVPANVSSIRDDIMNRIPSVQDRMAQAMSWATDEFSVELKFIALTAGIPALILKAILDFVKNSYRSLLSGFDSLIRTIINRIKSGVSALIISLGLGDIPTYTVSPTVYYAMSLIEQTIELVKKFSSPGELISIMNDLMSQALAAVPSVPGIPGVPNLPGMPSLPSLSFSVVPAKIMEMMTKMMTGVLPTAASFGTIPVPSTSIPSVPSVNLPSVG